MTQHVNVPFSRIHYNNTYTSYSPRSICRVARCGFVYKASLGKGRAKAPPLHPPLVEPHSVATIGSRRLFSMPQTYWRA